MSRSLPTALLLGAALAACSDGATGPGDSDPWVSLVAGGAHACALTESGDAYCWGSTTYGQAGQPVGPVLTPKRVPTETTLVALAAGGDTTCGLTSEGALLCWGNNALGQLGDGRQLNSYAPVAVAGGMTWSSVSVGTYHVCGITTEGELHCWGGDRWDVVLGLPAGRECDAPDFEPRWPCQLEPLTVGLGSYGWVEAGLYQTCAGTSGSGAVCWGRNDVGQLGTQSVHTCSSNDSAHPTPTPCSRVPIGPDGVAIEYLQPGSTHGCGLDGGGSLYCWGGLLLNFGQVGDGTLDGSAVPVQVDGGGPFTAVYTSHGNHIRTFSCGIEEGGTALCWGADRWGQLGSGTSPQCTSGVPCRTSPTPVAGGYAFRSLALGVEFACGLTTDAEIVCWGTNGGGQLGDGTLDARSTPATIARPS